LANTQVTAVLETKPPIIPDNSIPFPEPSSFIRIYPTKPNPDVNITTHPISLGFKTLNGPRFSFGKKGNINNTSTTNRMKSYSSSLDILPIAFCNFNLEDNKTTITTVIIRLMSIMPKKLNPPKTNANNTENSVVETMSPVDAVVR